VPVFQNSLPGLLMPGFHPIRISKILCRLLF